MAETNMAEVLKAFATKVTTSSVSERVQILSDLHPCVVKPDFPEGAVKGIIKHLILTLGRYYDGRSRHAVDDVISLLAQHHKDYLVKHLVSLLSEQHQLGKKIQPCRGNSGASLCALGWTCLAIRHGIKTPEKLSEAPKMIELQTFLVHGALATEDEKVKNAVYKRLRRLWNEVPGSVVLYLDHMKTDGSLYSFCMISCLIQYLHKNKKTEMIDKYKADLTDLYVKNVIGCRTNPPKHVLVASCVLLRHMSHDGFRENIVPAVGKAMLRNPEVIIQAVCEMIGGLTLDLSKYAMELSKPLATQCCSKEDDIREVATVAMRHLASQCSDSGAVEKLAKHLFSVYNGSEGKLSVAAQRVGVTTAIGNLSNNTVTGSSLQSLITTVTEDFLPVLQHEVHESTLVHAVNMFSLWCSKFTTQIPEKVSQWFKTGMGQKTSTSAVRNAYLHCMLNTFTGDSLLSAMQLLPTLLQTVEKATPTQLPLVTEALTAACLLVKLSLCDIQAESKLDKFWSVILDPDKQLFVNEKFLSQASDQVLQCLSSLVERLTLDHPQKFNAKISSHYYRGLVFALTHGSYKQRKHSCTCVTRMVAALGGVTIARDALREFRIMLVTQKVNENELEMVTEIGEATSTADSSKYIAPRVLCEALSSVTNIAKPDASDATAVAMDTMLDAHHPCIVAYNQDMWTDILTKLGVDAKQFVEQNLDDFISDVKNTQNITQSQCNAIATLTRISPKIVPPRVIELVTSILSNPALCTVTLEEFEIMNTPEGEMYDKSVIESGNKEEVEASNMRRENKLYSYKEQMAEIELRKEIEKKKAAKSGDSKKEAPKLSKKQMELLQEQKKKESEIRKKCLELDVGVDNMCQLISACMQGNPPALRLELTPLLHLLLSLTRSPLVAPRATKIIVNFRNILFEGQKDLNFALSVIYATLRLMKPACELESCWCEEPVTIQAERCVSSLHNRTVSEKNKPDKQLLSAPAFAYCFYLLKNVVDSGGKAVDGDNFIMTKALAIITAHAQLRDENDLAEDINEFGPELLPREEMMILCSRVIGTSTGKLQQMATRALLAVADCGSGQEGCTAALQPEIDVLLENLQAPASIVREASLLALASLEEVLPTPDVDRLPGLQLAKRIWVSRFDVHEDNKKLADSLWNDCELTLDEELCTMLVDDVVHSESVIREATAIALATAIETHKSYVTVVIQQLLDLYEEKLYMPPPEMDIFGRVVSEAPTDQWCARAGIALAIDKTAPLLEQEQIEPLFLFFVNKGLADRHEDVKKHMLGAAVSAVNNHGKKNVSILLPVFEKFLKNAPTTKAFDAVRQSVVILMGSLAKHLDKDDPKVKPIVAKLIQTLSTPSQQVQEAVANCLPPLVPAIKADAPKLITKLLDLLLESNNYGERKGAAYGLAGLVKGLGILSLKQHNVMSRLTEAIQNKKNAKVREGSLFAFEMLCVMLGRLFEPYVVHILPFLLLCFGDNNHHVREAADDCAKAVMSKLSAHGVKLILPSLLSALEEDSWRTKAGSVELLGAMAFCAPKQLSACLPSIVPKLSEVLTDSHSKVQEAGAQALKQIGSVIRNPEIQEIVPVLLAALQDPTKKTTAALQCLLDTQFVHFIDAPSLALIMPVVQRSFQDRSPETRKMAAQIIGNMYSLTDQKDLSPYLPSVIPGLKQSLLDPAPEVRTVSARALGAMVKGMGESGFEELVPWLMSTLTSEQSTVDRSGAAQGLSEVVGGLGLEKLEKLMPDIITTSARPDIAPHVRDGYIMMFIYLPTVFGDEFVPYVGPIIPGILQALADENEYVRETALKAGQRLVNMYADTSIELLLPQLEKGLFDDNWRIRSCSVQLLGDLLYKISGVSGKMSTESAGEDDNFGTSASQQAILKVLGHERRNRVLAGLYMGRSDTALMVRQAALHVWKVIVAHTPKTLREILSTLFQLLLGCLASTSYDKRQVAARTLGDIVRKLGEKVLPEIIPILEKGLDSNDSDQRQGVCIGLSEIMTSTSKDHVIVFADSLIPTVRKALIDPLPEVRQSAAETFSNLHSNIGPRALDEILPNLLKKLDDSVQSEYALDGLKQVMAVKSKVVLPYLVPQLTSRPVNTRALSFLSAVAGDALTRHLPKILPALLLSLSQNMDTEDEQQELDYCQAVVLSVHDEVGVRIVMEELLSATSHEESSTRCAAVTILHVYCEQTKVDLTEFVPQLFRGVIHLFIDDSEKVLVAAWSCLNAITKKLDSSEMLAHISNVRQAVKFAVSDLKGKEELPGLCLPKKGLAPVLPIFREGLLNGPPEMKEQASYGLGELIRRTSADALKPSVVNITGPLIRVLGDRFSFNVKVAVLDTLALLLGKCGVMLKPFLPQLQTTFIKALNDPTRAVRLKAAGALGKLVVIHTKVDPLFVELHSLVKNAADTSIRDTTLQALRGCICGAGSKMSEKTRSEVLETLESLLSVTEETSRMTGAACLGALCDHMTDDQLAVTLTVHLLDNDSSVDWIVRHGRSVGLAIAVKHAADKLSTEEYQNRVTDAVLSYTNTDRIPISLSGLRGIGFILRHLVSHDKSLPNVLLGALAKTMKSDSNDVKALSSRIVTYVSRNSEKPLAPEDVKMLMPMLVNGSKEKNSAVKSYSETALIEVLALRHGEQQLQTVLAILEPGLQDVVKDMVNRVLRKVMAQPVIPDDDIDDTLLV